MEWRGDGQGHRALGAHLLGDLDHAVDCALVARQHDLARVIVVGDGADFALRRDFGDARAQARDLYREAPPSRPADGHGLLHRLPAQLEQLGGGSEVERTGGRQRGIFAEAVAGDEVRRLGKIDAAFLRQRSEYRHRMRHDRRLRIFREPQVLVRPVAHQAEEVLSERFVDLVEDVARGAAGLGQSGAHADGLAALSRKKECAHSCLSWFSVPRD